MPNVVSAVGVHAVEIVAAVHESEVLGGEGWEAVAELGDHASGVVAVIDGVGEPGDDEFEFAFAG